MSHWHALLLLLAGLAVVGLVDVLIVVGGLEVERADQEAAQQQRASERRPTESRADSRTARTPDRRFGWSRFRQCSSTNRRDGRDSMAPQVDAPVTASKGSSQ
jgi:hypothetical protein